MCLWTVSSRPSHPRQSSVHRFSVEFFRLEPFRHVGQGRGPNGPAHAMLILFVAGGLKITSKNSW